MVYVFLAPGFEETEALAPTDIMRRAKIEVKTVGVGGDTITGSHGITVKTDCVADEISPSDDIEMIVLPGGMPGTLNLEADSQISRFINYCSQNGKFISAICAAPSILGHKGILNGKKATCFPGFEKDLTGACIVDKLCVNDGLITTAKGAGASLEFGLTLVSLLRGEETSLAIRKALQCK